MVQAGYSQYNSDWESLLVMFNLTPCSIVDIGANDGTGLYNMHFIDASFPTFPVKRDKTYLMLNFFCLPGDTSLNLGYASNGGTVIAIEMGPPLAMLRHNVK